MQDNITCRGREIMTELALPASVDTERMVLGSFMLEEELLHVGRPALSDQDFSIEKHRLIFRRMVQIYDDGRHVDRVTVSEALRVAGELNAVDGLAYIVSLDDGLPRLPDVSSYIRILKDHALSRRIMEFADNLQRRAANQEDPQSLIDSLAKVSMEFAPPGASRGLVSAQQLIDRDGISEILAPRIKRGVAFPWPWLNNATCGMLPGELWVLAGHTSTGKSSAAIQTAVSVARSQSGSVPVFSLEMSDVSVFQRAVWQISRVNSENAKRGTLSADERKRALHAANELRDLPIYFDDSSFSVAQIHAQLRRQRTTGPIGLVVVDYLQLLRDGSRHNTRAEAVGANARALKVLAAEFECPVLLLSQFSRESAKPGKARRPELHDLKESGDIENHSNGVWFIHREDLQDQERVPVEFLLPKQRDGRRNVSGQFYFLPNIQRFDQGHPGDCK
jgi:replicative DNA helicase